MIPGLSSTESYILGAIVLMIAWAVVVSQLRGRRKQRVIALAQAKGYEFLEHADLGEKEFVQFGAFQGGLLDNLLGKARRDEHFDWVFQRVQPEETLLKEEYVILNYNYERGSGRDHHVIEKTAAVFGGGGDVWLTDFALSPKGSPDKTPQPGEVHFDGTKFSDIYLLRAGNEKLARALFSPEVRKFFEENPDWRVDGGARWIVVYKSSVIAMEMVESFLKTSRAIFDKLARDMHPEN